MSRYGIWFQATKKSDHVKDGNSLTNHCQRSASDKTHFYRLIYFLALHFSSDAFFPSYAKSHNTIWFLKLLSSLVLIYINRGITWQSQNTRWVRFPFFLLFNPVLSAILSVLKTYLTLFLPGGICPLKYITWKHPVRIGLRVLKACLVYSYHHRGIFSALS